MRAVVDGEMHQAVHHRPSGYRTVVTPAVGVLAVSCWCERWAVAVPQRMVRWAGVTFSCGGPGCVAPDGERTMGVRLFGLGTNVSATR